MKSTSQLTHLFVYTIAALVWTSCWDLSASAASVALTGSVTSAKEGAMEGVLVSAKPVNGHITVTVVSDSQGRYVFPSDRLKPGNYQITIRAAGYELENPGAVAVAANQTATVDLQLHPTVNLAAQLSNSEWITSVPGTDQQKKQLGQCVGCHSLTRVFQNQFDAEEWVSVLNKMRTFSDNSTPSFPIKTPVGGGLRRDYAQLAGYLSSLNLHSAKNGVWDYELKTHPRPKGRGTRVIITEYDLPRRDTVPHDAAADQHGMVWYTDHAHEYLGRLNPQTGEFKEWPLAPVKPEALQGTMDIAVDKDGNPWFTRFRQGAITRFDKRSERVTTFRIPEKYNDSRTVASMLAPTPDGTVVWFRGSGSRAAEEEDLKTGRLTDDGPPPFVSADSIGSKETGYVYKLDVKTGRITTYPVSASIYGVSSTSEGHFVFEAINQGYIGMIDRKTGELSKYPVPTPHSGPRRGHVDAMDRFWFGEYWGNKIGVFDTKTKQFREWEPPMPWQQPYDAVGDRNGEAWSAGYVSDYVMRLIPGTGEFIMYLLPTLNANVRRIDVDNSTSPVTCWVVEDHHARLARIEPIQ